MVEDKNLQALETREEILDHVLNIYYLAAAANGWAEPPPDVRHEMDEIFRLITVGMEIKEPTPASSSR